ncbi:MAG: sigma-70 family RNA polymerase sigma factor [Rhodanobacteraceae bacterium]|nr:sigma-70 family RNA polymerase sigma factor [Rhodanobacteraceae bacterium]
MDEAITLLINRARGGDQAAASQAFAQMYRELKRIAIGVVSGNAGRTLSATALVHEAYLKLLGTGGTPSVEDRRHFFRLAAKAMRQIAIDDARRRSAEKRGGHWVRTEIGDEVACIDGSQDLLAIEQALQRLERRVPQLAEVVELRYFGGLTFEEIAGALATSDRSVRRDWETARVMLLRDLGGAPV